MTERSDPWRVLTAKQQEVAKAFLAAREAERTQGEGMIAVSRCTTMDAHFVS